MDACDTVTSVQTVEDVYIWGDIGKRESEGIFAAPVRLPFTFPAQIKSVASGADFTLILLENGKLFGFGNNFFGQLGIKQKHSLEKANAGLAYICKPTPIEVLPMGEYVSAIAAGESHALLLSSSGIVYSTGSNMHFQLGSQKNLKYYSQKDDTVSQYGKHSPSMIPFRDRWEEVSISCPVRNIAAGKWNNYAVGISGAVYSWGTGAKGALGHPKGDRIDFVKGEIKAFFNRNAEELATVKLPRRIESLYEKSVHILKASAGIDHVLLLSETKELFSCGEGRYGRLGTNSTMPVLEPSAPINENFPDRKQEEHIVDVFAAGDTSFAIRRTELGNSYLYTFGQITSDGGISTPTLIPELSGCDISGVSSTGTSHIAWNSQGDVYIWGKNSNCTFSGIANFYSARSATNPVKCGLFTHKNVVMASCGKHCTFVVSRDEVTRTKTDSLISPEREICQPFVQILHTKLHPGAKELSLAKNIMLLPTIANKWRLSILGEDAGDEYNALFHKQIEDQHAAELEKLRSAEESGYLQNIGKKLLGARILDRGYKVKVWMQDVYVLGVILTKVSECPVNGKRISRFRVRWLREDWVDEEVELNSDDEVMADNGSSQPNRWLHGWAHDISDTKALF
ncbi:hypothetical protein XU18_2531 [Perkinsela sp. CCAP 1560/4]|nr:hypothetical protein XU18_2531 [Perkinsela sp. CCAP 1560/4]|eukprot:KNH06630.1 hypothetical protein XU18_2531 [Perkinsela sp. CCAP 1560/4]